MDFTLTPEQELIRASARELCERELVPHARDVGPRGEVDRALVAKLAEAGFLGAGAAGGARRRGARHGLVLPALRGARPRRLVGARDRLGRNGLFGKTIAKWGTEEQKQRVAAAAVRRRGARLLRAHRARLAARIRLRWRRGPSATATSG